MSEIAIDSVEIAVAGLRVEPESVRASAALLSDAERQRAGRFAFDRDRRRFTAARARLRLLLAERLGVRPAAIELTQGVHGKPALARRCGYADWRFNVSHCEDVAVYAFAPGREIEIDVEAVRALRGADDIAAHFFSRLENEAYFGHRLDRFDVSMAPDQPAKILRVENTPGEDCGWRMESFRPGPGFIAAVVTEAP